MLAIPWVTDMPFHSIEFAGCQSTLDLSTTVFFPGSVMQQTTRRSKRRSRGRVQSVNHIRCVCGDDENDGLMICCEECDVWQHCDCMGLSQENMPDMYWCEMCKPENFGSDVEVCQENQTELKSEETDMARNLNLNSAATSMFA